MLHIYTRICLNIVFIPNRRNISKFLVFFFSVVSLTSRKEKWKPMSQQIFIRYLSLFLLTTKHFQISTITPPNKSSIMMVTNRHTLYLSFRTSLIIVPFYIFLWKIWLLTTLHYAVSVKTKSFVTELRPSRRFVCSLRNHFQIIQNKIKM